MREQKQHSDAAIASFLRTMRMKMPKYQSALQHYVAARIFIFPEDDSSEPRTQARIVRTGGDTIEGFVEVTIFGNLDIQASIAFTGEYRLSCLSPQLTQTGVSRIWIESYAGSDTPQAPLTTVEHKVNLMHTSNRWGFL